MRIALAALTLLIAAFGFVGVGSRTASTTPSIALPESAIPSTTAATSSSSTTSIGSTSTTATTLPSTTTTTALSTASLLEGQSLAARSDVPLPVFTQRDDAVPMTVLDAATMLGTPRVVQVLEGPVNGWARVALPIRPNGSEGWVRTDELQLFVVDRRVDVDLSDRSLTVTGPDGVMLETTVAVGSETSPTPVGDFFVTDSVIVGDTGGPWGPHAFGLSAFSDTITEFNGGDGIIGIHGTNQPGSIGHARSLGCVRVPNEVALELAGMISAGVPVQIRP